MTVRKGILLALFVAALATNPLRAVDIYVLTGSTSNNNITTGFGKIDIATATYTEITSAVSGSNAVRNLAWNAANSNFYVVENASSNTNLRTLDLDGNISASIGTITKTIWGMAYREADSTLYAYDYGDDDTGTIDPDNGAWSILNANTGTSSSGPVGGHYTMLNDTIYVAGYMGSGMFATIGFGASDTFQQIGNSNPLYQFMSLASDGANLYGVYGNGTAGQQRLYQIDPATGGLTDLGSISGTGLNTYFYGAGMVPVPEPSTYLLGGLATGVMFALSRRRKAKRQG